MGTPSDTSAAHQKTRFRRRLILVTALTAILVGTAFASRPAWHYFKSWRSRRLAAQAESLMARNAWPAATEKARAAFLLSRTQPSAQRALARALSHATNAAALQLWQVLIANNRATITDRQAFIELAIRVGAPGEAASELKKLLAQTPPQPVNLWLASQFYAALGDRWQTEVYAARAYRREPTNQQYRLFWSSLHFNSPEASQRIEARSNLWAVAQQPNTLGLEAVEFLAHQPGLTEDDLQRVTSLLQGQPANGIREQLLALRLQIRLKPTHRAELLDQAAARYESAAPETRQQFAVWLNQLGEFQRTLDFLPMPEALKRQDYFLARADAMAALGQWEQLQNILNSGQAPLEAVYASAFRARCALQLANAATAAPHWRQAVRAAERNPEQLLWLAQYAEKCGQYDCAKSALRSLISCVREPRPIYLQLARLIQRTGTPEELRDLLAEMLRRWPDDPAVRHDYTNLVRRLPQPHPASN